VGGAGGSGLIVVQYEYVWRMSTLLSEPDIRSYEITGY
jgi:hypothetical protein